MIETIQNILQINDIIIDTDALPNILLYIAIALFIFGIILKRKIQSLLRLLAIILLAMIVINPRIEIFTPTPLTQYIIIADDVSASQQNPLSRQYRQYYQNMLNNFAANQQGKWQILNIEFAKNSDYPPLATMVRNIMRSKRNDEISAMIILSDGILNNDAVNYQALENIWQDKQMNAPIYFLQTSDNNRSDVNLNLEDYTPVVGLKQELKANFKIEGNIALNNSDVITIFKNQQKLSPIQAKKDINLTMRTSIEHAREYLITAHIDHRASDNQKNNNYVQFTTRGLQEKLRVLMLSDAPHPNMRIWRNLLKSDPYVSLEHYAVLRSPKQESDQNKKNELTLIAFPAEELFFKRLEEFDLVILDRIHGRGLVNHRHFRALAKYVKDGGALLTILPNQSLYIKELTKNIGNLNLLLSDKSFEIVNNTPWRAHVQSPHAITDFMNNQSINGLRHYITTKAKKDVSILLQDKQTSAPILMIKHDGKGRLAQLNSSDFWRVARAGNSDYQQLLRNLTHWLLQFADYDYPYIKWQKQQNNNKLRVIIEGAQNTPNNGKITVLNPHGEIFSYDIINNGQGIYSDIDLPFTGYYHVNFNNISEKIYHHQPNAPNNEPRLNIPNQSLIDNIVAISNGYHIDVFNSDLIVKNILFNADNNSIINDGSVVIIDQQPMTLNAKIQQQRIAYIYLIMLVLACIFIAWFLEKKLI